MDSTTTLTLPSHPHSGKQTEEQGPFAIEVANLTKRYSGIATEALGGVSFCVKAGEIFGLLGPNGAGKTTTMGILTTRVRPTSGEALVVGIDVVREPATVKKNIAVVPQALNLDNDLNPRENLLFHAAYFGVPRAQRIRRADELLDQLGLRDWKKQRLHHLSGGMAQRVMIARALMTDPALLFLDEPTTGLDPQSRLFLWDTIRAANKRGTTIILTTHNMDEADQLCHHVGIIDHGRLIALDTPVRLKNMVPGGSRLELQISTHEPALCQVFLQQVKEIPGVKQAELIEEEGTPQYEQATTGLRIYAEEQDINEELILRARHVGVSVREIRLAQPSLENLFIYLTGRELRA